MTLLSPLEVAIAELLADTVFKALTTNVRPEEPGPGDVQPPESYRRYVVVLVLDGPEDPSLPIVNASLGFRYYGTTKPDAIALYNAGMSVFRRKGPRIATSRLGVYQSIVVGGGGGDLDQANQQPYRYGVVEMVCTTQAVPA